MNNNFFENDAKRGGLFSTTVKKISVIEDWIRNHKSTNHQAGMDSGWIPVVEPWTYASASSFTIPTNGTVKYQKGMAIRWKNAGDVNFRYGNLANVAATVNTIFTNTDYVVANSAITDVSYSQVYNPYGFPAKFNCTSTISGSGGTAGAYAETVIRSYFIVIGKSIQLVVDKIITNKGSWSGNVYLATPRNSIETDRVISNRCIVIAQGALAPKALGGLRNFGIIGYEKQIYAIHLSWTDIAVNDHVIADITYLY